MLKKLEAENIGFNMVHIHAFLLLWITIYKLPTSKSLCKETKITSFRSINLVTLRQKNIYYLGCGWVSVKLSQNISGFWPKKWFQPKAEKISDYMVHTHGFVLLWFTIYFNIFFIFSFFKLCKQKREKGGGGRQKKTKRKTKRKTKNENENKNDVFNLLEFRGRLL